MRKREYEGFQNVNMEKNIKIQLDKIYSKLLWKWWKFKDWRRKNLNKCRQQEKKKEMDWTHIILTNKNGKTDDAVLDADLCIWKASRWGPSARRVATSAIWSCLGSIERKKNQQNGNPVSHRVSHKEQQDITAKHLTQCYDNIYWKSI